MAQYLDDAGLQPPYVLVAHSYGGTFAREFLQAYPDRVAGMVLAETGQETALDPAVEAAQYRQTILGSKPLSVIRGNTMLAKRALLDSRLKACKNEAQRRNLRESPDFKLLVAYEKEDEDLKKRQLKLSRNHRYVRVHDCGHDVIEDRPEIVWEEVQWVMAQITGPTFAANAPPIDPSRGSSVAITIRSSASRILNRFRLQ